MRTKIRVRLSLSEVSSAVFAAALTISPLTAAAGEAPTLSDVLDASGVTVSGYLDVTAGYLDSDGVFTSGASSRVFDGTDPDGFTLDQAALTITMQRESGLGAMVNLTAGDDADVIAAAGSGSSDNFDVTQAFVQYAFDNGLTVIGGKFVTLSGSEVISTPGNVNLSRSILFGYAIPFTHTGVRATFKVSDVVTLVGGVNNGWDQQKDQNDEKTAELGIILNPTESISVIVVGYSGDESGQEEGVRNLLDIVATYAITDALTVALNYDTAKQENAFGNDNDAQWSGWAAYLNFAINDQWRASVRGEVFDDEDGFRTGVDQEWSEVTVTFGYSPVPGLDLLAELRADDSNESSFVDDFDGETFEVEDSQSSVALKAIYQFGS